MINKTMVNTLERLCQAEIKLLKSQSDFLAIERNFGCVDGDIIGTGQADFTQDATYYNFRLKDKVFTLIDIPGIEGNEVKYKEIIRNSLEKTHVIFYVNGSGKKIEKDSLEKIRDYMHDGTSVYAIFNIHCKAKLERLEGIDKTYTEELMDAYTNKDITKVISNTEDELKSFLGDNFLGSIILNGLQSFCSCAYKNNKSTIIDNQEKNLNNDQNKYLKEYKGDIALMKTQSQITEVSKVIEDKIDKFDEYIYQENIKKLRNRLSEASARIKTLKEQESKKIKEFDNYYIDFESRCTDAKETFLLELNHIGQNAVEDAYEPIRAELFEMIENDKGKTESESIKNYFEKNKDRITDSIQDKVNKNFERAQNEYRESLQDAQNRLKKDFERSLTKFEVSMNAQGLTLDTSFLTALKYDAKDFGKHAFSVGSLIVSGAFVGNLAGPIGALVGGIIGGIVGILFSIWNTFASTQTKINRAKSKLDSTLNDQIYELSTMLKTEIKRLNVEDKILEVHNQIIESIEIQRKGLKKVDKLLCDISISLEKKIKTLE